MQKTEKCFLIAKKYPKISTSWFILMSCILIPLVNSFAQEYDDLEKETSSDSVGIVFGNNGLWIEKNKKNLIVHWLTPEIDSGLIELYSKSGNLLQKIKTAPSMVHSAEISFRKEKQLNIRFGSIKTGCIHKQEIWEKNNKSLTSIKKFDTLYALGDLHGEYENLIQMLKKNQLIDANYNWTGGKKILLFLGDICDRGPQVNNCLWLIYKLYNQAPETGGKVLLILGNHELMTMANNIKYLHPSDLKIASFYNMAFAHLINPFTTILGNWIIEQPSVIKIDRLLFSHGGIYPPFNTLSIDELNNRISMHLTKEIELSLEPIPDRNESTKNSYIVRKSFLYGNVAPFWFRGYALSDTCDSLSKEVNRIYDVDLQVIGHTPGKNIRYLAKKNIIGADLLPHGSEILRIIKTNDGFNIRAINLDGQIRPLD